SSSQACRWRLELFPALFLWGGLRGRGKGRRAGGPRRGRGDRRWLGRARRRGRRSRGRRGGGAGRRLADLVLQAAHLEAGDQLGQFLGLLGQHPRGGGRLLDHGRVLLGDVVHLVDRRVDLVQAERLLLGRGGDLADHVGDLGDLGDDALQGLAGLADQGHALGDLLGGGRDQAL